MLLKVEQIRKNFKGFQLGECSFSLEPGYILGLVGANGAGKSTLLQCILGMYTLDEGEIFVDQYSLRKQEREAKDYMGFVLDQTPFEQGYSAVENGKAYGRYYHQWNQKEYETYLKKFEVPLNRKLSKCSKGMKIKMQLAFALSHSTKLLVMDEPTGGLDIVFRRELFDILRDITRTEEKGILFSTHLTEELENIADYIVYLRKGQQVFFGSIEQLREQYRIIKGSKLQLEYYKKQLIAKEVIGSYEEGLTVWDGTPFRISVEAEIPTIEKFMYYMEKGGKEF